MVAASLYSARCLAEILGKKAGLPKSSESYLYLVPPVMA